MKFAKVFNKKRLNRFLDVVGNTPLTTLSRADLKKFESSLAGLQAKSINRYMGIVKAALNDAGEYFPDLEEWEPPRILRLKELPGRERVIMPAEIARLLANRLMNCGDYRFRL